MIQIETVFCWFGGVLTESLPETIVGILFDDPIESVNSQFRLQLQKLSRDFSLGRLTGGDFCRQVVAASGRSFSADQLETVILSGVSLRAPVVAVLVELADRYRVRLVSDYPPEWYASISDRLGLNASFSSGTVIFPATSGLARLVPDIFYSLAGQAGQTLEHCLMVDGVSARAVEATRHHMQATIFVDAKRLRREFVLRRMLPPPPGFVYPGPNPNEPFEEKFSIK